MKNYVVLLVLLLVRCSSPETGSINSDFAGKPGTPEIIREQHEQFLQSVEQWALLTDSTGAAAKKVLELLHHHFNEEEEYALPLLSLLPLLSKDSVPGNAEEMIALSDKLKQQLGHLSVEHQVIVYEVNRMTEFARAENHPDVAGFELQLVEHAKQEEDILFPAAIVVGEYLKLKTNPAK